MCNWKDQKRQDPHATCSSLPRELYWWLFFCPHSQIQLNLDITKMGVTNMGTFAFLLHRLDLEFFCQYFLNVFLLVCALITNIGSNIGIIVSDAAALYIQIPLYLWALVHKLVLTALSRDALSGDGGSYYSGSFTRCGARWSRVEKGKKISTKITKLISSSGYRLKKEMKHVTEIRGVAV